MIPRTRRSLAALALLTASLPVLARCGGHDRPEAPAEARYDSSGRLLSGSRRQTARPNVVLVCIDTVRADAIEPAGGEPPVCPLLAGFAKQCVRFSNASASAAWTAPSVTTLLTGLWPSKHGVEGSLTASALLPAVATLAEYLKEAGYATEAMTGGGWVSGDMGHLQGFDRFTSNWSFVDENGSLARWVRSWDKTKPFFLFLHTYDAHDPYGRKVPPEGEEDPKRVAEADGLAARLKASADANGDELPAANAREILFAWRADPLKHRALEKAFGEGRVQGAVLRYDLETFPTAPDRDEVAAALRAKYRAGLRLTDDLFGGILARLDEANIPVNTVTFVVSDHGESFGEHDDLGHGRWLYDELTRVVMLARAPGRWPPSVLPGSVGLVDVVPTILDVCGLPPAAGLDGRSLVPVIEGKDEGHPVRAEEHRIVFDGGRRVNLRLASIRSGRGKWIATWDPRTKAATEEIYDLAADPAEKHPLAADAFSRFGPAFADEVGRARESVKK